MVVIVSEPDVLTPHHGNGMMSHHHSPPKRPATLSCPTCGVRFLIVETQTPPFCSERCQLIDLGRWLDEEISLPFESEPESPWDETAES